MNQVSRVLFCLLIGFSGMAYAKAEVKIAVVDFRQALMATDVAKKFQKTVEKAIQGQQDDAQALVAELQQLEAKRKKDGAILSSDESEKLLSQMQGKQRELRKYEQAIQRKVQELERDFMKKHGPVAEKVTRELITEKGYDMVLNPTAVVHALPKHDLTKLLRDKLNKSLK